MCVPGAIAVKLGLNDNHLVSASCWCKRRTPTAIEVDCVRTVERERARRTVDTAGREDAGARRRGRAATRERTRSVREVLEVAVLAGGGE